jgi:O-antigen ligase/polysaccharide polymerase Wzy-like membrane protein
MRLERLWIAAILFTTGWNFALPATTMPLPVVFTPVQVVRGIFLPELLLASYIIAAFVLRWGLPSLHESAARWIVVLIFALSFLGVFSAAVNDRPLIEVVSAGRYVCLALYFAFSTHWAKRYGSNFVLRVFLLGILASGFVTLYYTFVASITMLGGLPMLLGQNGPGGYLGIAVLLSAWLMAVRRSRMDALVAQAAGVIGVFAASISYSKLAMLMAGIGLIAWLAVLLKQLARKQIRIARFVLILAIAMAIAVRFDLLSRYFSGVGKFVQYKFVYLDRDSVGTRFQYFLITAEIVASYPLAGVGYGGFYDAATATDAYKMPYAGKADPDPEVRGMWHPESSFLYHAYALGVPGLVVVLSLFLLCLNAIRRSLWSRGLVGKELSLFLAAGYLIFGLTLPTLFNTAVLYVPAAVSLYSAAEASRRRSRMAGVQESVLRRRPQGHAPAAVRHFLAAEPALGERPAVE